MGFSFDELEVRKAIAVFHPNGKAFEVRLVDDKWNAAGVFNSADQLIDALNKATPYIRQNANVYFTLNSLNDACHDRKHRDTFMEYAKPTVSDNDIVGYDWLLIDLDPKRPAGTSSTDEQVIASRETAKRIMQYLLERGWPDPVIGHSGNGTHLLYRIELSTERKNLLQDALKALNMLFSDSVIDVDMTTFNPGRICKLYGTVARKGASTEKRPHRMSKIKVVPDEIKTVPVELIEKISSDATEFLSWKYAPAKTQFDFEAHTNDEFGNSLKAKLRKKGFSISEKLSGGKILTYLLDDNNTIVRLILSVDTTTYGKVYDMNGKNDYKWTVMRKGE